MTVQPKGVALLVTPVFRGGPALGAKPVIGEDDGGISRGAVTGAAMAGFAGGTIESEESA